MGSSASEMQRESDEGPQHIVTIGGPFAVGKYHVTVDQFAAFASETRFTPHSGCDWRKPGFMQDGSHPVVCVSWDDANAYAKWLTNKTGRPYRLPSEAEFEYAARAGATTPFWWGASVTPAQANYDGNYVYAGVAAKASIARVPCRPEVLMPIHGVSTTFTAMRGSGWRIAITTAITARLLTARPGHLEVAMAATLSAAVPGAVIPAPSAPPTASGIPPRIYSSGFRLARALTP